MEVNFTCLCVGTECRAATNSGHITYGHRAAGTQRVGVCVSARVSLEVPEKTNLQSLLGIEIQSQ